MEQTTESEVASQTPVKTAAVKQLGSFKLVRRLGEGAMGSVYLADDVTLQRQVAVKVLGKDFRTQPRFVERFMHEAQATAKLSHANIVAAFAAGQEHGLPYYVMEYCDGESLDRMVARLKRVSVDKTLDFAIQVARGLQYAHKHGFIHRDIKPGNIIVTKDGTAKILDLGLSKHLGADAGLHQTATGVAVGTPHYISPEQVRGEQKIDGRTDIYALGATLYHLLTGQPLFDGNSSMEVMAKHLTDRAPNPQDLRPEIPTAVAQILQRALAKSAAHRYGCCATLLEDLEAVRAGGQPHAHAIDSALSTIAAPKLKHGTGRHSASMARARVDEHSHTGRFDNDVVIVKKSTLQWIAAGLVVGILVALSFARDHEPQPPAKPAAPAAEVKAVEKPVAPVTPRVVTEPDQREQYATRQLQRLQELEQGGRGNAKELRKQYEILAQSYGMTAAGKEAARRLQKLNAPAH